MRRAPAPIVAASAIVLALADCSPPGRGPPCAPGTICTIAGSGEPGVGDDGLSAHETRFYLPTDVAVGPDGLVYVADFNNHRVVRLERDGTARVIAGSDRVGDGPPGPATASAMIHPAAIAFDEEGRMLIAAWHNFRIKRVDLERGLLEDFAGVGEGGYFGDGAPAIDGGFDLPSSLAFDRDGGLLIVDQANQVIRRIGPDGMLETFAGRCVVDTCDDGEAPAPCGVSARAYCGGDPSLCAGACIPGYGGDAGDAREARFGFGNASPAARIAVAADGAVYVADTANHRVRRIGQDRVVTTIAGTGDPGYAGDGGLAIAARLDSPGDVAVGPDGTLYVADTNNACIRAVDEAGVIDTFAGRCGERGIAGDGGAPERALLDWPYGIHVDGDGRLFIADTLNNRVRMIEP